MAGLSAVRAVGSLLRRVRGGRSAFWHTVRVDHEVVRKAPLFAALDSENADALLAQMSPVRMERGDILFREGEGGDSLYVIGEGKIKLGRSSSDGRENLVAILDPARCSVS